METIVDRLTSASLAIALMAAGAWLVCRVRPSLPPSTRSTLWWFVAVAALVRLVPIPVLTVEVPGAWRVSGLLPAATPSVPPAAVETVGTPLESGAPPPVPPQVAARVPARVGERRIEPFVPPSDAPTDTAAAPVTPFDWRTPLVALWAVVACALFARLAIANWRLRRVADDAGPVPAAIGHEVDRLAGALRLRRTPAVRVSDDIETPQVFGLFRPTVLLPQAALTALTPRERAMTLCHELAHVRRLDLAFAWAPAVLERLLFFHPGARLAAREYAFAREAACDADVLQHLGEAPRDYGRLLLRLGVKPRPAALAVAQSSPSTRMLRRRLALLNDHEPTPRTGRARWVAAALLLPLALPLSLVARQSDPPAPPLSRPAAAAPTPPVPPTAPMPPVPSTAAINAAPPSPPAPPASARLAAPASLAAPDDGQAPPPPPPPPTPEATTPPPPPPPPPSPSGDGFYWVDGHQGTIVLFDGEGTSVFSGSSKDAKEARRLRGDDKGPFLYYRANGKAYVSRDRALIDRVRGEMREQRELGEKQGELGHLQAELGAQQGALGARQAHMASRHAAAAHAMVGAGHEARLHALETALATLEAEGGEKRAELEAAQKALREAIATLRKSAAKTAAEAQEEAASLRAEAETMAARQRDVADEQRALGRQQAELGRKQAELGRHQRAAADAARQRIMRVLEEAAAAGQAQPVK
jgi:beta-lactamase regulating signal transducer with metallopeptidase domain